jgi:hypothetical protein
MICRLIVLFSVIVLYKPFFTAHDQQRSEPPKSGQNAARKCNSNPDPLYVRSRVLDELADILNNSIPEYSKGVSQGFYSDNDSGIGFFVVDLTNPTNKSLTLQDCVDFINGHVYHVAPSDSYYSLSHIVILEKGKLKVFRSVNCPSRGDRLEDAINYVSDKLSRDKQRDETIDRVRNYKKYGFYGSLHHAASICKDAN